MAINATDLKFSAREVIGIVLWAVSLAGLYFGIGAKIDRQAEVIVELRERAAALETQLRSQDRSLAELTVTLRVKDILK